MPLRAFLGGEDGSRCRRRGGKLSLFERYPFKDRLWLRHVKLPLYRFTTLLYNTTISISSFVCIDMLLSILIFDFKRLFKTQHKKTISQYEKLAPRQSGAYQDVIFDLLPDTGRHRMFSPKSSIVYSIGDMKYLHPNAFSYCALFYFWCIYDSMQGVRACYNTVVRKKYIWRINRFLINLYVFISTWNC